MLIVGAIAHWGIGEVSWTVVVSLLLGQIPGVWFGARISSRYDGQELRWLLLVLVGSSGIALLGAPTWLATTITVVGVLGLGIPILLKHYRKPADDPATVPQNSATQNSAHENSAPENSAPD